MKEKDKKTQPSSIILEVGQKASVSGHVLRVTSEYPFRAGNPGRLTGVKATQQPQEQRHPVLSALD